MCFICFVSVLVAGRFKTNKIDVFSFNALVFYQLRGVAWTKEIFANMTEEEIRDRLGIVPCLLETNRTLRLNFKQFPCRTVRHSCAFVRNDGQRLSIEIGSLSQQKLKKIKATREICCMQVLA